MIQLQMGPDAVLAVIEPGNIRRLKEGKPLTITLPNGSSVLVCYTPDYLALANQLGVNEEDAKVPANSVREFQVRLTPDTVQDALDACLNLPEVYR